MLNDPNQYVACIPSSQYILLNYIIYLLKKTTLYMVFIYILVFRKK